MSEPLPICEILPELMADIRERCNLPCDYTQTTSIEKGISFVILIGI